MAHFNLLFYKSSGKILTGLVISRAMLFLGNGFIFTLQILRVKGNDHVIGFLHFPLAAQRLRTRMWLILVGA